MSSIPSTPTKVEGEDRRLEKIPPEVENRRHRDDSSRLLVKVRTDGGEGVKIRRMHIKIRPSQLQKLADNKHLFSGINIVFEGDELYMIVPDALIQVDPGKEADVLSIMASVPIMHTPFIFLGESGRGLLGFSYASDLPHFIHRDGYSLVSISGVQQTIYTLRRGKDLLYLTSRTLTGLLINTRQ